MRRPGGVAASRLPTADAAVAPTSATAAEAPADPVKSAPALAPTLVLVILEEVAALPTPCRFASVALRAAASARTSVFEPTAAELPPSISPPTPPTPLLLLLPPLPLLVLLPLPVAFVPAAPAAFGTTADFFFEELTGEVTPRDEDPSPDPDPAPPVVATLPLLPCAALPAAEVLPTVPEASVDDTPPEAPPDAPPVPVDDDAAPAPDAAGCCCCGGGGSLRVDMSCMRTPGPAGESSSTIPGIVCVSV